MDDLLKSYQESLRLVRDLLKRKISDEDRSVLRSIESDLVYAIDWMKTGRRPGNRRGIERRAAYQREKLFDPLLMQKFFRSSEPTYEWDEHERESSIISWDWERIEDALSVLTERERETYLMSRGYCLTYSEIANYLCISSSSVQTMIERAERKIKKRIKESLFCMCG
ncbi:sigma factor-like helix-turn-helix DNA-binding protein [Tepidibacillus fermentans]|uniref:RNA polymerase sigma-70 factor (ECF subfamily) n=1 Tax=Tepidibacillus fermentans TaxID=1281767 RepID=A0A4R3KB48_9BACI|nr:sigma factor-like helix-turn-helix DNA-binding protein [Tepidibacillus fermentans]TCS80364.1 RNA polymerase sigma-70 factor (ECF subfamily) [Tepidibacillus fermentans]